LRIENNITVKYLLKIKILLLLLVMYSCGAGKEIYIQTTEETFDSDVKYMTKRGWRYIVATQQDTFIIVTLKRK
jgi:hypothetical protein